MPASMLGFLAYNLKVTYFLKKIKALNLDLLIFFLLHINTIFFLLQQFRLGTVAPSVHVKYAPGPHATLDERLAILREWTLFSSKD